MTQATAPSYLRTWFLKGDEFWDEFTKVGIIDSSEAWKHFEPLITSKGYQICIDRETKPERPQCDFSKGLGNPFQPFEDGPFAHFDPEGYKLHYEKTARPWVMQRPKLTYAYDHLKRIVVIKALTHPAPSSEIEIISYLNSPELRSFPDNHTIPLLDHFISDEGWQFLVMPAWRLSFGGNFLKLWQVDDYFEIFIQSFEGLAFMHRNGIAHRDISAWNIVFNGDGTIQKGEIELFPIVSAWDFRVGFIDFGFSTKFDLESDPSTWTSTKPTGTHYSWAPENISASETGIPYQVLPADVYALGSVWKKVLDDEAEHIREFHERLYEFVKTNYEVFANELLKPYVPELGALLDQCVDEDPHKRPTAEEALDRLRIIRETLPRNIRFAPPNGYSPDLLPKRKESEAGLMPCRTMPEHNPPCAASSAQLSNDNSPQILEQSSHVCGDNPSMP